MILHIFKKDARRLWPHIAVTLALLGSLTWHDRWRSDFLVDPIEGWLNLLMPLVWAFLIGLAMEQEPLVGDREFWITRPYRRTALLAAKALFVVAFIHVPYFLASAFILRARGFPPALHLPELLWNQLLLAAGLTLPAMALASLVRNFTHFVFEVVIVAGAAIFLSGSLGYYNEPLPGVDAVRKSLAIVVAGTAACALLWMQYGRGRLMLSRAVGLAAGILTVFLVAYLLPQTAFGLRSALKPVPEGLEFHLGPRDEITRQNLNPEPGNRPAVALPIELSGVPAGMGYHVYSLRTEITTPGGDRYRSATTADLRAQKNIVLLAGIIPGTYAVSGRDRLSLAFDRRLYARLKTENIRISGDAAVILYRLGESSWLAPGETRDTVGAGRCTSLLVEGPDNRLKVECESTTKIPGFRRVRLWHPETGEVWKGRLGEFGGSTPGPQTTWLSPLFRSQTSFLLTTDVRRVPGNKWLVPAPYLSTARVEITPELITGYSVVHFDFTDVPLTPP